MFSGQMLLEEEPHSEGKEAEYMYEDAGGGCFFSLWQAGKQG